jgi:hypothetical protein
MRCIERELYGMAAIEKLTDKAIQSAIKASSYFPQLAGRNLAQT